LNILALHMWSSTVDATDTATMASYSVDVSNNNSTTTTMVYSSHLFPKPSHNTTVS